MSGPARMAAIDLNPADFQAIVKVLAEEYGGDSAAMVADLRRGQKPSKAALVQPRTAGEVVALKEAGILNQTEARKYLGLRPSARAKRAPSRGVTP